MPHPIILYFIALIVSDETQKLWNPSFATFSSLSLLPLSYLLTHSLHGAGYYLKSWLLLSSSKNILLSYGTRRFITVFTKARYWTLSWASFLSLRSKYFLQCQCSFFFIYLTLNTSFFAPENLLPIHIIPPLSVETFHSHYKTTLCRQHKPVWNQSCVFCKIREIQDSFWNSYCCINAYGFGNHLTQMKLQRTVYTIIKQM
jgi:hypothetical protein